MITGIVLLGIVLALVAFVVGIYNKLVTYSNRYKNAFAQIEVQLKRRHDLIPNLVIRRPRGWSAPRVTPPTPRR